MYSSTVGFGYETIKAMYLYWQKGYPMIRAYAAAFLFKVHQLMSASYGLMHSGIASPSAHTPTLPLLAYLRTHAFLQQPDSCLSAALFQV